MSKTALFKAAKTWDVKTVEQLLERDPGLVKACDGPGRTALHLCAGHPLKGADASRAPDSIATARALLSAGADVNAVHEIPDDGQIFPATPLWYAVARGLNRDLVRFLLRNGANPDYCLWAVVWSSDVETARLLLKAGSRTELRFDNETPLLYAARLGREAMIMELLKSDAKVNVRDSKNLSPLDYAIKRKLDAKVINALGGEAAAAVRPAKRRAS